MQGMQGVSTLPQDSPSVVGHQRQSSSPNNNIVLPPKPLNIPTHPASFRQQPPLPLKKPPMPSPPSNTTRMDPDVSTLILFTKIIFNFLLYHPITIAHKIYTFGIMLGF